MSLPVAARLYPLGPYSLTLPTGTYWFPSTFRSGALIPGTAARALRRDEAGTAWRLDSDGLRVPAALTLTGDLVGRASEAGLRSAARTLQAAAQDATALIRDNGDGTTREIALDGGRAQIMMVSRQHYRATVTLYPTGASVTTGTAGTVPTQQLWLTDTGDQMVTDSGDRLVFLTP